LQGDLIFSYTADSIAGLMVERARDGLVVQGVFEAQNAGGSGAEFYTLKSGGVDVLEDGNCYIMANDGRSVQLPAVGPGKMQMQNAE
jgi:hypothetical protein